MNIPYGGPKDGGRKENRLKFYYSITVILKGSPVLMCGDNNKSLNHNHPLIHIRGVTSSHLQSIIELIYFGERKDNDNDIENNFVNLLFRVHK